MSVRWTDDLNILTHRNHREPAADVDYTKGWVVKNASFSVRPCTVRCLTFLVKAARK